MQANLGYDNENGKTEIMKQEARNKAGQKEREWYVM
jgi:hypothetical protein